MKKPTPIPGLSEQMLRAVQIDDIAIDEEFIRLPADLAYWNAQYAKALRVYLLEQHECEVVRARLFLMRRAEKILGADDDNQAPDKGKTKGTARTRTVDDIKALVTTDPEYHEAAIRLIEAEAEKERLKKFCEAVASKKDMLQSLGAKLRIEMMGDPIVRDQHRALRGG